MLPPLLFIPGAACDDRLFAAQMTDLEEVVVPRFAGIPEAEHLQTNAERLLTDAPERFAVAGLSLGGLIALELQRLAPERITHLILMDTSVEPDPPPVRAMRQASLAKVEAGFLNEQVDVLVPFLLGPMGREDPDLVATARAMAFAVGPRRYASQLRAIIDRPDPRPQLEGIHCPCLVLCGADDIVTPPAGHKALAGALPNAAYAEIEGAGHLASLEQPALVTGAIRPWLAAQA